MLQPHTRPTHQTTDSGLSSARLSDIFQRAWRANRSLALLGIVMLGTLAVSLAGLALDPRVITGSPAWLKPFKFSLSIALYSFTLLWMLTFVEGKRRWVRAVSVVSLVALVLEMVIVITQVVRGTTSHFNVATAFDTALFSAMGMLIMAIWAMNLVAAGLLLLQRLPDLAFAWALRLGLVITLLGGASGALMLLPTPAQQGALGAGELPTVVGAHSVGVVDGGPAMPLTGWNLAGGDLRIGHFVGLHALQAMPIVGWLLARRRAQRLGNRRRVALLFVAAFFYLGIMALTLWQALRGQPLLTPDAQTLFALAALLGASASAGMAVLIKQPSKAI